MTQTTKLTPMEQAMNWERMSGERLSDADRKRITDGGEFVRPTSQTTNIEDAWWLYYAEATPNREDETNYGWASDADRLAAKNRGLEAFLYVARADLEILKQRLRGAILGSIPKPQSLVRQTGLEFFEIEAAGWQYDEAKDAYVRVEAGSAESV